MTSTDAVVEIIDDVVASLQYSPSTVRLAASNIDTLSYEQRSCGSSDSSWNVSDITYSKAAVRCKLRPPPADTAQAIRRSRGRWPAHDDAVASFAARLMLYVLPLICDKVFAIMLYRCVMDMYSCRPMGGERGALNNIS